MAFKRLVSGWVLSFHTLQRESRFTAVPRTPVGEANVSQRQRKVMRVRRSIVKYMQFLENGFKGCMFSIAGLFHDPLCAEVRKQSSNHYVIAKYFTNKIGYDYLPPVGDPLCAEVRKQSSNHFMILTFCFLLLIQILRIQFASKTKSPMLLH